MTREASMRLVWWLGLARAETPALDPDVDDRAYGGSLDEPYDHPHDSGAARHYKVDLELQRQDAATGLWTAIATSDTDDNKQRVYTAIANPTADAWRLQITGRDVTSDAEGCGVDSTRVYFAWLYEDQDRDTGTSLDTQIRPEVSP